ncbi:Kunitz/Bovine pancreatic trypsin inhibitor domain protein, partial [Oesophagostomum dentatum]
ITTDDAFWVKQCDRKPLVVGVTIKHLSTFNYLYRNFRVDSDIQKTYLLIKDNFLFLHSLQYYYDKYLRMCLPYSYSGCGGGSNSFGMLRDCLLQCQKVVSFSRC